MADFGYVNLHGIDAVKKALASLDPATVQKICKTELANGAEIIKKAAQSNAQSMVGGSMGKELSDAMEVKVQTSTKKGVVVRMQIDPDKESFAAAAVASDGLHLTRSYIPAAIEYGHAGPGKAGSGVKVAAAIPFMRRAFEATKNEAMQKAEAGIARTLEKEAQRIAR
jgi:hypothetical protein